MEEKNEIQVFSFNERPVRIVEFNGEHWWVAKDVCDVLGIGNITDAMGRLEEDEFDSTEVVDSLGRRQQMQIVNEPGLYSLIMGSRKPEARAFKRWVTHEVLPSLNRRGYYVASLEQTEESAMSTLLKTITRLEGRIASLEESFGGNRFRAAMIENASKRIREELPAAPPFTKIVFYPVSRSFDADAQEFVAEHIKNADGYGAKKRIWEALQELSAECGWKIGSKASFYRICDALSALLEAGAGVEICRA